MPICGNTGISSPHHSDERSQHGIQPQDPPDRMGPQWRQDPIRSRLRLGRSGTGQQTVTVC